mgnify:CR=1 FL=1
MLNFLTYLLQYYLSKLEVAKAKDVDLQSTNDAGFIPRTVFLNAIKKQYAEGATQHKAIMELLAAHDQRLHTHIISVATAAANMHKTE